MIRALSDEEERAVVLNYELNVPIRTICREFHIHRSTFYRILVRLGIERGRKKS